MASSMVPAGDDDALTTDALRRYPVDDITETTTCELHVKVVNISMKVAVGYAVPIGPTPTFHCSPVPLGYAIVGVDEVFKGFEELKLDHPAGEDGEIAELGEARKNTILWRKELIVLPAQHSPAQQSSLPKPPSPQPRSPARESSPPKPPSPQPRSPARQSPPPQSPARQSPPPQSPPRESAPPQSPVRSGRSGLNKNRSPKRTRSPLPKVPHKNLSKRPYDYSLEENKAIVKGETDKWFANLKVKKAKAAEFPDTPEEKAAVSKMLKTLAKPPPKLTSDYDRYIVKSAQKNKRQPKKDSAIRKTVAQLGKQQKQSCPPLKVFSDTEVGSSKRAVGIDPEFVALYGEAASAHGLSIAQYLDQLQFHEEIVPKYKYRHGHPLVKPELVDRKSVV